jgi:hypothetical protein
MHWFRWHHGTVTDPKLGLIAKKAGVSMAQVIAIWGHLLEAASMSEDRGNPGVPDFESMDFYLEVDEGVAQRVYGLMQDKGLIAKDTGRLVAWERRQPKREREDDTGTERKRRQRGREAGGVMAGAMPGHTDSISVTPCHATSRQVTPRGEERREEEIRRTPPYPPQAEEVGGGESKNATKTGSVCKAIKAKGVSDVNPSNPKLRALVDKGVAVEAFEQAAELCTNATPPKGMAYLLAIVERQLREAADIHAGPGVPAAAWDESRSSIEAKAAELGIAKWNDADMSLGHEQWPAYFARVRAAVEREASHI